MKVENLFLWFLAAFAATGLITFCIAENRAERSGVSEETPQFDTSGPILPYLYWEIENSEDHIADMALELAMDLEEIRDISLGVLPEAVLESTTPEEQQEILQHRREMIPYQIDELVSRMAYFKERRATKSTYR